MSEQEKKTKMHREEALELGIKALEQEPCDNCEVGNPCLYCRHEFEPQETETWNGIHGQITAPKGTFERIFNEADDDNDI